MQRAKHLDAPLHALHLSASSYYRRYHDWWESSESPHVPDGSRSVKGISGALQRYFGT